MNYNFQLIQTFNGWCFHSLTPDKKIAILQEDSHMPINNYIAVNLDSGNIFDKVNEEFLISIGFNKQTFNSADGYTSILSQESILSLDKKYLITGKTESPFYGFKIWIQQDDLLSYSDLLGSIEVDYADYLYGKISPDSKVFIGYAKEFLDSAGSYSLSDLNIFDLTSNQSIHSVQSFNCACTSQDIQLVAYHQGKKLHIFRFEDKKLYTSDNFHYIISVVAISENKSFLLSGNSNKTIGLWNIVNGTPRLEQILKGHPVSISKLAFGLDDQIIISTSKEYHFRRANSPSTTILYKSENN
ncbi:WD40 repeat domain-containing protein [Pseudanabaena yagii]|uniref:WD40 repeat domain-containing protein n=1 Tax=Pseudanabaena yagii GIHE-NHR1 TaxID=2722753 RepID=A0ABX1LP47_9CYAN|nr:hypothetical protein [Pseudanabaena yagii]NMF57276.1 hypothetical protein [Pseudanabaena yagii GIHE-NHR1]